MATEIPILQLPTAEVIQAAEAGAVTAKNDALQAKADAEAAAASVPSEADITGQIEALTAPLVYASGAYPARPDTAHPVTYIGPVQPTTWLPNDSWVDNS